MKQALIVYGGWQGHEPEKTALVAAEDLRAAGFAVELSTTLDTLADEAALQRYDLIVPNWTMGTLAENQQNALLAAIKSGVGLGGFHGGMGDAFRNNPTYQYAVGGQWVAHPDGITDYTVQIVKPSDPIVAGLADFAVQSEQYYMHVDPSNEVLATTVFHPKCDPWVDGTVMPVVWKRRFGLGRVFYSSIGHTAKEFEIPEVREITRRGLLWAARG